MTKKLKPCPACLRNTGIMYSRECTCLKDKYYIRCANANCSFLIDEEMTPEAAILSWNRRANESKWVKFDAEDESTWPAERTRVWVISKKRKKIYIEHFWKGLIERYSHWMEIEYPQPPEEE
jgi:hypothetical protein